MAEVDVELWQLAELTDPQPTDSAIVVDADAAAGTQDKRLLLSKLLYVDANGKIAATRQDGAPILRFLNNHATGIVDGDVVGELQFDGADPDALASTVDAMGVIRVIARANINNGSKQSDMAFLVKATSGNYDAAALEVMRLTHAGNVGIKTAAPGYPLDVNGVINSLGFRTGGYTFDVTEGDWTPTLTGSVSNPTYSYYASTNLGHYLKFGPLVFYSFLVRFLSISGGSGNAIIGMPFAAASGHSGRNFRAPAFIHGVDVPAGAGGAPNAGVLFTVVPGTSNGLFGANYDDAASAVIQVGNLVADDYLGASGFYLAA